VEVCAARGKNFSLTPCAAETAATKTLGVVGPPAPRVFGEWPEVSAVMPEDHERAGIPVEPETDGRGQAPLPSWSSGIPRHTEIPDTLARRIVHRLCVPVLGRPGEQQSSFRPMRMFPTSRTG